MAAGCTTGMARCVRTGGACRDILKLTRKSTRQAMLAGNSGTADKAVTGVGPAATGSGFWRCLCGRMPCSLGAASSSFLWWPGRMLMPPAAEMLSRSAVSRCAMVLRSSKPAALKAATYCGSSRDPSHCPVVCGSSSAYRAMSPMSGVRRRMIWGQGKRRTNAHVWPVTSLPPPPPLPHPPAGAPMVPIAHRELMQAQHTRHARGRGQRTPVCQPTCLQFGTAAAHGA